MKSAAFDPDWLVNRLAALAPGFPDVSLCVALSGGVDSVALLAALAAARTASAPALRAIHVHHGLHPNAGRWAQHCRQLAGRLNVPLTVLRVKVPRPKGSSLEAMAREARYEALAAALDDDEVMLTAHHQDDQLETVLLQLFRGAGIPGLAAMPDVARFAKGWLARPLLTRTRAEIEAWAREHGLTWVEDDSNANEQLDRNYLRRSILPLVRERWPGVGMAVARSARHVAEARRLLDALALADVERAAVGAGLSVQRLRAMDADRRKNALRFWIARCGATLPDSRRMQEIAGPMLAARADATPHVRWNDALVERHADVLTILHKPRSSAETDEGVSENEIAWSWRTQPRLELTAFHGVLTIERDRHGPLDLDALPATLIVRARRGGESLRPRPGARTRKVKALLQESRVSPRERDRLPLIFGNGKLIAVCDRWFDAEVQATGGSPHRGRIRFRPRG